MSTPRCTPDPHPWWPRPSQACSSALTRQPPRSRPEPAWPRLPSPRPPACSPHSLISVPHPGRSLRGEGRGRWAGQAGLKHAVCYIKTRECPVKPRLHPQPSAARLWDVPVSAHQSSVYPALSWALGMETPPPVHPMPANTRPRCEDRRRPLPTPAVTHSACALTREQRPSGCLVLHFYYGPEVDCGQFQRQGRQCGC